MRGARRSAHQHEHEDVCERQGRGIPVRQITIVRTVRQSPAAALA
jgi:hypothetical protein